MYKTLLSSIKLIYILALVLISLTNYMPPTWAQSNQNESTNTSLKVKKFVGKIIKFIFPKKSRSLGAPKGRREAASRGSSCPSEVSKMTALVPLTPEGKKGWGLTSSETPTFWVYIPKLSKEFRRATFTLQEVENYTNVYFSRLTLPETTGVISIDLSADPKYKLEHGKRYRWFFRIYCRKNPLSYVSVYGIIERATENDKPNTIWYDILSNLGNDLRTNPEDSRLKEDWAGLMGFIGLEKLAQEPLLSCCTPGE